MLLDSRPGRTTVHDSTLTAQLVSSLAWPVAAVVIVAMLRPALLTVLAQLRRVRVSGVEAEFGQELARVRDIAESADLTTVPLDAGLTTEDSAKLLQLAAVSPRSAVIEAWGVLEAEARAAVDARHRAGTEKRLSAVETGRALRDLNLLDEEAAHVFDILRGLRNQVVHEPQLDVTANDAVEFANLARQLSHRLETRGG